MKNDSVNPSQVAGDSAASVRIATRSTPPPAPKRVQRTSLGHRLQRALTGGPNRRFPGLHSPLGAAAAPSLFLNRRLAFPILALLALLTASLLFLLSGGLAHGQDDASVEYAENGMGAVATFTATDPEGRPVYWSLLATGAIGTPEDITPATDSAEVAHFSISANGVLSFNFPPDYEAPPETNAAAPNTYRVVVVAADEPLGVTNRMLGYKEVTVNVTDMDEPGMITLDAQQPQESKELTATLIDDDASDAQVSAAKWKWEHSESKNGPWAAILTATAGEYTPLGVADKYLRATATYTDVHGSDKNAQVVTPHMVRAVPAANNANPVFPDEDTVAADIQVGRKVDENSPPGTRVGDPVVANDAPGDVLTYTFGGGTNDSSYSINAATGQITVGARTALDREALSDPFAHTVTVTATDPAGGEMDQEVTITINDVNEVPVITAGNTKVTVAENAGATAQATAAPVYVAYPEVSGTACEAATCTWSLKGTDAGDFNIGNQTGGTPGQLTFKAEGGPNYEAPADANRDNVYMVTVVVTDAGIDGKGKLSAERDVVVTVTNVNEGTLATTVVTLSSLVPKVGVPLTATLSDPDGGEKDIEWQWSIDGAATATLPGTPTPTPDGDIDGAESDTYTPKVNDVGGTLTASVMYADAVGSGQTGTKAAANAVVQDLAAKAPVFDPKPTSRSVPENYATGNTYGDPEVTYPDVGAVVTATDPNGDTLTYSLGGADAGSFDIGQDDGQIEVKPSTELNLEAKATYRVTVTASDPGGLSDSVDVTIKLTNVDEGPEIMVGGLGISGQSSVDYAEDRRDPVATYTAVGPDAASARWTLSGDDAGDFTIGSSDGVLTFRTSPNYEAPADADTDNVYKVTVTANDGSNQAMRDVTVTVADVDEQEPEPGTLLERYDTDDSGDINQDEVIEAINDYLFGEGADAITKDQAIEVINLYLFG